MIIKAAERIFNSDKICRSYSDLNFGVTFLEHSYRTHNSIVDLAMSLFSHGQSRHGKQHANVAADERWPIKAEFERMI